MNNLYARSVFFVHDAEDALRFYTEQLGFSVDWNYQEDSRTVVCQVSLYGFELILNEVDERTQLRAGNGRVFIGLDDEQGEPLGKHIVANRIRTQRIDWGRTTLVVKDLEGNEIFFWLPHDDFTILGILALESSGIGEAAR